MCFANLHFLGHTSGVLYYQLMRFLELHNNNAKTTNINWLVASHVFSNHRVLKGVSVTVKLLPIAKRPSFLSLQFIIVMFFYCRSANLVLMGGIYRRKSSPQFPPIKTQIVRIIKTFVATEKKAVLRRAATWWLRKTQIATRRLELVAIKSFVPLQRPPSKT